LLNEHRHYGEMSKTPVFGEETFVCPHCGAYAHQLWYFLHPLERAPGAFTAIAADKPQVASFGAVGVGHVVAGMAVSGCAHCRGLSLWVGDKLCWPAASLAPSAHAEMPPAVLGDYKEASDILGLSPRGACALIRLCIQKLFAELGAGTDLNKAIATFAGKGLNPQLVHAMDILRVVGNNAVHPGEMDLKDDSETASQLFELLNEIVDELISRPARTARLYAKLPAGARAAIEERDKPKRQP